MRHATLCIVGILAALLMLPAVQAQLQPSPDSVMIKSIDTKIDTMKKEMSYMKSIISVPSMDVHGTEYQKGDDAKAFLQLLDDERQIISNATCYTTIYYPNTSVFKDEVMMSYLDNGLYFYDLVIPDQEGVYMISAACSIESNVNLTTGDNFECGDFDCNSSLWLADWEHTANTEIRDDENPRDTYHMRLNKNNDAQRGFDNSNCTTGYINFWAKSQAQSSPETCDINYWNGTDYNTIHSFSQGNQDDNTYRFYSFEICNAYGISANSSLMIENGDSDKCWIDDIEIYSTIVFNTTQFIWVRGSGEMHVSDHFTDLNVSATIDNQLASNYIWNNTNRSLTGSVTINETSIASAVWSYTGIISNNILTQIASAIWNFIARYTHGVII